MLHLAGLEGKDDLYPADIEQFVLDTAWAAYITQHTILGSSPWAAVFGHDMLFDLPYFVEWRSVNILFMSQYFLDDINEEKSMFIKNDYAIRNKHQFGCRLQS